MKPEDQKGRARKQHYNGMQAGNTCIDCHKGIAHNKVHDQLTDEELDALEVPHPENKRPIPEHWLAYMEEGKKAEAEAEAEEPQEIDAGSEAQVAAATEPEPATALESAVPATAESEVAAAAPADATPEAVAAAPVAAAAAVAAAPAAAGGTDIDWSSVEATEVVLFYPGQSSMEWVLNGRDHGGARPLKAGDRCLDCHEGEESAIGDLIVSGEKLEPNPISGKRGSIAVNVPLSTSRRCMTVITSTCASSGKIPLTHRHHSSMAARWIPTIR
jgi:hypothetical protein